MSDNKATCEDCSHIKGPIYTEFTQNYFGPLDPKKEWHFCPAINRDWRVTEAGQCRLFKSSGTRVHLARHKPSEEVAFDRWMMEQERRIELAELDYSVSLDEYGQDWDRPELGDVMDDGTPYGWDPDE